MSLLELVDLTIEYGASPEPVRSLDGVNFVMSPGEIVALVGESGSGKSTLAAAVGHLPIPGMRRVSGQVRIGGREVASLDRQNLQALRRNVLGYIFQDPVASLDPTMKLSRQVELALDIGPAEAAAALDGFGFADVVRVLRSYPHEVSGGMAQRVTIAMVMRKRPRLVVADEPTAALDAPVRAQILDLLVGGCRRLGAALAARHPRSANCAQPCRPHGRDVCRPHRRERPDSGDSGAAQAPVHSRAACRGRRG